MPSDIDWITRTLNGERDTFGMLVRKYQQKVYALALSYDR
jgi:hypothetical protein